MGVKEKLPPQRVGAHLQSQHMGGRSGKTKISRLHHETETSLGGSLETLHLTTECRKEEKRGRREQKKEAGSKGQKERAKEG